MARRVLALALLALVLPGCRETAVVLSIHAKAKIPGDLDAIGLQVVADGGLRLSRRYPLQSAPQSLSVVAGDDPERGFELKLTGQRLLLTTSYQQKLISFSSGIVTEDLTVPACETQPPLPAGSGTFHPRNLWDVSTPLAALGSATVPMWAVAPGVARRMGWTNGVGGLNMYAHEATFPSRPGNDPVNRLVAVDIDNDASLDLLLLTTGGPRLWRHKEDDSFEETFGPLPTTANFKSAAAGDLNGDGYADLVLAGPDRVTMLFSDDKKPGSFTDATSLLTIPAPEAGAVAVAIGLLARTSDDLGQPGVVLARETSPDVLALRGAGGTFNGTAIEPALPKTGRSTSVVIADVNRDGFGDVAFGRVGGPSVVYLNSGGATPEVGRSPEAVIQLDATTDVDDLVAADLHNDCRQDLILASRSGVLIYENGGVVSKKVSFSPVTQPEPLPAVKQLIVADFSGDGLLDLAGQSDKNCNWYLQLAPPK